MVNERDMAKTKIGVMGSAEEAATPVLAELARGLGEAIAARDLILLTGATTGVIHLVGKAAREAGAFHIGISPGEKEREHVETFQLPTDACDAIVYRLRFEGAQRGPGEIM